jgi:AbiV family abortive infection protein
MPSTEPSDQTKQRIEACLKNAGDSLRAAKRVLDDEKLPNIGFHLTVLALEEIGKAALLGAAYIADSTEQETNYLNKRMDDHQFKLFWALWAPNLARGNVCKEDFEKLRGMAKGLHEERLDAMYVSVAPGDGNPPLQQVSEERARTMLALAEARLGMESAHEWQAVDVNAHEELKWFLEATADPEKRKLIFGNKAFEKLAELGHMRQWMAWLKEQFDTAEAQGREKLQRELARVVPDGEDRGEEKWQLAIRLHSPSQSIRNRTINAWNTRPTFIRLAPVGNDAHAIDVEFKYQEAVSLQELGPFSYRISQMFIAALNIGSMGFWWWHLPDQRNRFYERLADLKASPGMKIDFDMNVGPKFEWKRDALDDGTLSRVAVCFGIIVALEQSARHTIIESYLTGLALTAKSDLHLNLAFQASERFAASLLQAMQHFGDWDGTDEGIAAGVSGFFGSRMQKQEDVQELIDLLQQLRRQPPDATGITLERAAVLKVIADGYLNIQFDKMAQDRFTPRGTAPPTP